MNVRAGNDRSLRAHDLTPLVGTEAITETPLHRSRPMRTASRATDARCRVVSRSVTSWIEDLRAFLCVMLAAFWLNALPAQDSTAQERGVSEESVTLGQHEIKALMASADTVYRWQLDDSQASFLVGDCDLHHGEQHFKASKILIVSDGPRGRVRNRVVFEGLLDPSGKPHPSPRQVVWKTETDPLIQAVTRKGEPRERPFLMEYLPNNSIQAIGNAGTGQSVFADPRSSSTDGQDPTTSNQSASVQAVQFTEPLPSPSENLPPPAGIPIETIERNGVLDEGGTIPLDAATGPVMNFAPPLGPTVAPAPENGLPLATPSSPPVIFDDGATTGGFQLLFGGGTRAMEIKSRNASMPPMVSTENRPGSNETVWILRGGVTAEIRDVSVRMQDGQLIDFGTVTLSADRIVAWTPIVKDIFDSTTDISASDGELYLEGDVVFRAGENLIYADAMFYNVTRETGLVLDAEAITTIPEYQGVVRLKAEVLQQVAKGNYRAFDAAVTSSRMGVPRYWLQSEQLQFTERIRNKVNPVTNQYEPDRDHFVTSRNNFVFLGGLPVLYWPRFATSLEKPVFFIRDAKIKNDDVFGTQVLLDWDVFQLLGVQDPNPGVDWVLSTGYMSERGPALGTEVSYELPGFFHIPGFTRGELDVFGIYDDGTDRLGRDRLALIPETKYRGRALLRHQQELYNGYRFIGEIGWLSDRNFLEQFLENEWDQDPDTGTALTLQKYHHNQLCNLTASVQVNDFFQETERLPALDHYLLGGSFLGEYLTWQMHNHVSYSKLNKADDPKDPTEAAEYFPLPGEEDREGAVASTHQQLSVTLPLGPLNVRPTAAVEASYYGQASDGNSLSRVLGQAGVAMDLPMVRVDPTIQSSLFNVRGMAHKMNWIAEYWYADSDTDLDDLPLYDELDDNAQEQFRRRFIGDNFGGVLPGEFDPRTYAFRQGIQRYVTSPSDVIADDLQQLRFGLHQRFQTKRGLPGQDRIVDLLQFDIDTILFPDADRDNFGETVGPTTYDFRYHLGDRYSILSDGYIDFFEDGLRSVSLGLKTSRPGVGEYYLGLMSLEGPISSTVLRSSFDYRLNEKWIISGGTTYDFGNIGNVGQSYGLTRIGESLLVRVGINVDSGRDNVGFGFLIEPRFFARNLGRIGGGLIPPPGIEGLE